MQKLFIFSILLLMPSFTYACSGGSYMTEISLSIFGIWIIQFIYFLYKYIRSVLKKEKNIMSKTLWILFNFMIGFILSSVISSTANLLC